MGKTKAQLQVELNRLNYDYDNKLRALLYLSTNVAKTLTFRDKQINQICYNVKEGGLEYGYYHTECIFYLVQLLRKYSVSNLFDLGAGIGLLLQQIKILMDIRVAGIENEKELFSRRLNDQVKLGDLLKLKRSDVKDFNAFYMWEPIKDDALAKIFIEKLTKSTVKGDLIFYNCAGPILNHIGGNKNFYFEERCNITNIHVFRRT